MDKQFLYSREAENVVLASCAMDSAILSDSVSLGMNDAWFTSTCAKATCRGLVGLYKQSSVVDEVILIDYMQKTFNGKMSLMDEAGGVSEVLAILGCVETSLTFRKHLDIVIAKYKTRTLYEAIESINLDISDGKSYEDVSHRIQSTIINLEDRKKKSGSVSDVVSAAFNQMERARKKEITSSGLLVGISSFDKKLDGFKPQDLVVIAARPSMGKTSLMLRFIQEQMESGSNGIMFSLEMSSEQLASRLICMKSFVNYRRYIDGFVSESQYKNVLESVKFFKEKGNIVIDDEAPLTLSQICARIRSEKMKSDIKWACVDYLQLISPDNKNASQEQQASEISRSLKLLAKELNIPIILLSQLNRKAEDRTDGRPRLADLRYSGAIEQDCDIAILIAGTEKDGSGRFVAGGRMILDIAKNRSGGIGDVDVMFNRGLSLFHEYSQDCTNKDEDNQGLDF